LWEKRVGFHASEEVRIVEERLHRLGNFEGVIQAIIEVAPLLPNRFVHRGGIGQDRVVIEFALRSEKIKLDLHGSTL